MDEDFDDITQDLIDYAIYCALCDKYGTKSIPDFETVITMIDVTVQTYKKCREEQE